MTVEGFPGGCILLHSMHQPSRPPTVLVRSPLRHILRRPQDSDLFPRDPLKAKPQTRNPKTSQQSLTHKPRLQSFIPQGELRKSELVQKNIDKEDGTVYVVETSDKDKATSITLFALRKQPAPAGDWLVSLTTQVPLAAAYSVSRSSIHDVT